MPIMSWAVELAQTRINKLKYSKIFNPFVPTKNYLTYCTYTVDSISL